MNLEEAKKDQFIVIFTDKNGIHQSMSKELYNEYMVKELQDSKNKSDEAIRRLANTAIEGAKTMQEITKAILEACKTLGITIEKERKK